MLSLAACSGEEFSSARSTGSGGAAGSAGSSGSGGSAGNVGLAADRTLDTLTAAEQVQLCGELRQEVAATTDDTVYRSWACTVQAWTSSDDAPDAMRATQCQMAYDSCLARPDVALVTNIGCDEIVPTLDMACTTVGALRNCYRLWGPMIEQAYDATLQSLPRSCSEAAQAGGVAASLMGVELDIPAECLEIRSGCGL